MGSGVVLGRLDWRWASSGGASEVTAGAKRGWVNRKGSIDSVCSEEREAWINASIPTRAIIEDPRAAYRL